MRKYSLIYGYYVGFFVFLALGGLCQSLAFAEPLAFGEIKASGDVQIRTSTAKWNKLQEVYPLLKSTGLKTVEGIAAITTREGSRFDLSINTEAAIEASDGSYVLTLTQGTVSFSIAPSTSLTVITKDADISVSRQIGGYFSLVAGPGVPSLATIQGMVVSNSEGTLIRSMTGRIQVNVKGLQARVINTGESLFASAGSGKTAGMIPLSGEGTNTIL
ncbi:MAG: hypothetical protein L6290_02955, partial [Thermodesulfovibrionales bacterium]|nr:hypothetical protein [Thermodesulfovibrionales bacterium]